MSLTYHEERMVEIERERGAMGTDDPAADAAALRAFRAVAQDLAKRRAP